MSVVGHAPPPFFKRGPAPLARLVIYLLIASGMIVGDVRYAALERTRTVLVTALWPMQQVAWLPVAAGAQMQRYFTRLSTTLARNQVLEVNQLQNAAQLLRQHYLEDENKRLRALLEMRERQPASGQVAQILYAARDPFSRRVIIDKGRQQGIREGQAVVDDVGVIGQVVRVFPLSAEVALLTDNEQAIPVMVARNGLRAVLAGAGAGRMELHFLASNAEIEVNDILVTSGLDGIYLPGLPVAKVSQIDHDSAYAFARILCTPLGGVERNSLVLVLEAHTDQPPRPPETGAEKRAPSPRGKIAKGR